jgi:hypothetical protein
MGNRLVFPGFKAWPEGGMFGSRAAGSVPPAEIQAAYEAGYSGIFYDPDAKANMRATAKATGGVETADEAAHRFGWINAGKGQLNLPFIAVLDIWPLAWPGAAQLEGSCVGHNGKNAGLVTCATEALCGVPDEVSRIIEGPPDVPPDGQKTGVFSICGIYSLRGYRGHGWDCGSCADVMVRKGGLLVAKNYAEHGLDLTKVTSRTENITPSQIPDAIWKEARSHQFRTSAECESPEAIRDAHAMGIGVQSCGSEGFSSTRNEHGVARRTTSWAHAMAITGSDDRPWAHQTYGGMLVLIQNSWAKWNGGPRDIHDSAQYVPADKKQDWIAKGIVNAETGNIMIPQGSFWARWSDVRRRSYYAMGGLSGWKRKKLPDYGGDLA